MAYSILRYPWAGAGATYPVNFPSGYLDKSHVTAYVENEVDEQGAQVYRTLTWVNPNLVTVSGDAVGEATLAISRNTPVSTPVHVYKGVAVLDGAELDESVLQSLLLAQEQVDQKFMRDFNGMRLTHIGSPLAAGDAVNLGFLRDDLPALVQEGVLASLYETLAEADAVANSLGKTLIISTAWDTVPGTIASTVHALPGAQLNNSAPLVFNKRFAAELIHVFTGSGTVSFLGGNSAYPEWFQSNTTPGTTNMTTGLNKALLSLLVARGTVRLSPTIYSAAEVALQSGVDIVGTGWNCIIQKPAGSNKYVLATGETYLYEDICIRDFQIDGNKSNCLTLGGGGVIFGGKNITVCGMYIHSTNTACIENSARTGDGTVRIFNNLLKNAGSAGNNIANGGNNWGALGLTSGNGLFVFNNFILCDDGNMTYGIDLEPNPNNTIRRAVIRNNFIIGGRIFADAGNTNTVLDDVTICDNFVDARGSKNWTDVGGTVSQQLNTPIYLRAVNQLKCTGNTTYNLYEGDNPVYGISATHLTNFDISGNTHYVSSALGYGSVIRFFGADSDNSLASSEGKVHDNFAVKLPGSAAITTGVYAYDAKCGDQATISVKNNVALGVTTQVQFYGVPYDYSPPAPSTDYSTGSYFPAFSNFVNTSAGVDDGAFWVRVLDTVTVYGAMRVTPAAGSSGTPVQTSLDFTLPVPEDLVNTQKLSGMGVAFSNGVVSTFNGDTGADKANMRFMAKDTGQHAFTFQFTYRIE